MKQKLLVLEDSLFMRRFYKNYLKNFEVICKKNGREGLQWLMDGNVPDGIMVDYSMPVMNGFDFISSYTAFFEHHAPIIMVSGEEDNEAIISCLAAGAQDFIQKPFHPKVLAIKVDKWLSSQCYCKSKNIN
ncbi:MAG: response regulator [Saprospiraceae bacterium]|nr:response regulator [Saprospiraceae bacterium]